MKKTLLFISVCAMALFAAACNNELEIALNEEGTESGQVFITASMDPETKATLAEGSGAFAFSDGDAIKVCNESGTFSGTTTSTGNSGTFAMAAGFDGSTDGIAGFPASLVSAMTNSTVTFTLPASYDYSEVGGTEPNTAKVPCPMIGSYNGTTKKVTLKQAGSVVRFRLTNVAAGTLSFSFSSNVTGKVSPLSAIVSVEDKGILASNFINTTYVHPGSTITVTNIPDIPDGYYKYITLPVPTNTAPHEILITNTPSDGSQKTRMVVVEGSSTGLSRAGGYKLSARAVVVSSPSFKVSSTKSVIFAPGNLMAQIDELHNNGVTTAEGMSYATVSEWKFGDYLEAIGDAPDKGNYLFSHHDTNCEGLWVDLFMWQGENTTNKYHGLISIPDKITDSDTRHAWLGNDDECTLYPGCWETWDGNVAHDGYIQISNGGDYKWRILSKDEWNYVFNERTTSELGGIDNARFARVKVAGVNGVLVFPDNVQEAWKTTTMGDTPNDINGTTLNFQWDTNATSYTSSNFIAMINAGFMFLPCPGVRQQIGVNSYGVEGHYWTSTVASLNSTYYPRGYYVEFKKGSATATGFSMGAWYRTWGRAVRLVRDLN